MTAGETWHAHDTSSNEAAAHVGLDEMGCSQSARHSEQARIEHLKSLDDKRNADAALRERESAAKRKREEDEEALEAAKAVAVAAAAAAAAREEEIAARERALSRPVVLLNIAPKLTPRKHPADLLSAIRSAPSASPLAALAPAALHQPAIPAEPTQQPIQEQQEQQPTKEEIDRIKAAEYLRTVRLLDEVREMRR